MANKLIGRGKECTELKRCYDSDRSEFVIVYGRRRVGKTFLLDQYFSGQYDFSFVGGHKLPRQRQLRNFAKALKKYSKCEKEPKFTDWFEAFDALEEYLESLPKEQKKVIFIDEMPWIDTMKSDFVDALENFWNSWAARRDDILFIASGSATSWMVDKLIENQGGLHARITSSIYLRPFNLCETEQYLLSPVAIGGNMKMEHAAKSDILGVALSKDIRSMLPLEVAQCSDEELYDVFLYKYATRNLQTFHHKSELLKPSRQVAPRPARLKGPMIVCVDRSGSMAGLPEELANSLMMKLLTIAERQKRSLYLISFSVEARPIEVSRDRTALLDFFRQQSAGDTNATKMLKQVFALLESGEYASADVLWFTDFRIPLCHIELRKQLTQYRRQGTKFYGLKIGHAFDLGWEEYFDEIVEITK